MSAAGSVPGYQEPNTYAIWDCAACHTMAADPRKVDARVYDAIYAVPGGAPGYDRFFGYARRIRTVRDPLRYLTSRADTAWGVYKALRERGARTVLEAGCGLGYLTYALDRGGYDVRGIDVSEQAVEQAKRAYGDLYETASVESYAQSSQRKFDAIVMVELIEHLEDPITVVRNAVRLLSPGGSLILTTPNRTFYGFDRPWSTDLPPLHLWWFSEDSIERLAGHVGHKPDFLDFSEYNARYPVLHAFTSEHAAMLDAQGRVLRKESLPMSVARRAGILHEGYWLATRAAGFFNRTKSPRRSTMVAILRRA